VCFRGKVGGGPNCFAAAVGVVSVVPDVNELLLSMRTQPCVEHSLCVKIQPLRGERSLI